MIPIPDKFDFPLFAQKHFSQLCEAVEVGAWKGEYAKKALSQWQGRYHLVDTWGHRPADAAKVLNDKNMVKKEEWDGVLEELEKNIRPYWARVVCHTGYSVEVANDFEDGSLDWIYIDAGHDYDNCLADLKAWWPKLRSGGFFTGDDYGISEDRKHMEPLTVKRFEDKFDGIAKSWRWGTAEALDTFFGIYVGIEVHVTYMNDLYPNIPGWYVIKP